MNASIKANTLLIEVRGGIPECIHIPQGIEVVIRDYHIYDEELDLKDENGESFSQTVWN